MDKKIKKDKNSFLIVWISCIVLLLTMCYFGVNSSSIKGTSAADASCYCPFFADVKAGGVGGKKYCFQVSSQSLSGWDCSTSTTNSDGTTIFGCTSYDACVSLDKLSCSKEGWSVKKGSGDSSKTACCPEGYKYYDTVTMLEEWIPDEKDNEKGSVEEIEYNDGVCVRNPISLSDLDSLSNSSWYYLDQGMASSYCVKAPSENGDCTSGKKHDGYCRTSEMSLCTKRPSSTIIVQSTSEACYYDVTKGEYVWGVYTTSGTISSASQYTTEQTCKDANPRCYKCNSASEIYGWSTSDSLLANDRSFCPSGGWSGISDSKDSCFAKKAGQWIAGFPEGYAEKSSVPCTITVKDKFVDNIKTCSVSMPSADRSGYTFDGWTKVKDSCSSPIKENESEVLSSNVNYYACWTKKSSGNGGDSGNTPSTPTNETYTGTFMNDSTQFATTTCTTSGGNSCILPAPTTNPTKDGYTFKGWGSSGCTDGWTGNRSGISSNQTYYACWLSNTPAGTSKPDSGDNVGSNPGTGPVAIAITWFVGIFAIAYSIFYFKKIKES